MFLPHMTRDISAILAEWEFQPGQLSARVIAAEDGEPRLQVRLDLGLIQMHLEGRPDGQMPYGFRSLLDYFEGQFEAGRIDEPFEQGDEQGDPELGPSGEEGGRDGEEANADLPGGEPRSHLTPEDCRALREELSQFNQRAVALNAMEDHERVARDAGRNLRVLDLCKEKAMAEADQTMLEQYRPYFITMRCRALASMALRDSEAKGAVVVIDEGLDALKVAYAGSSKPDAFEQSPEVRTLRSMRESLIPQLPLSQKAELRQRLAEALEQENYELAAILRDELKQLKD
jgi:hypothetical protein